MAFGHESLYAWFLSIKREQFLKHHGRLPCMETEASWHREWIQDTMPDGPEKQVALGERLDPAWKANTGRNNGRG